MGSHKSRDERIRQHNEDIKNGFPGDQWVLEYRRKSCERTQRWKKANPPAKKARTLSSSCFTKGHTRTNRLTDEEKAIVKERQRIKKKQYIKDNRERINARIRERIKNDPAFRITTALRKKLSKEIRMRSIGKTHRSMVVLGCDIEFFMNHLREKFTDGMSFQNYGKWQIDHIKPIASFDLADYEQQKQCFHYTNLQPLWAADNRLKWHKVLKTA